VRNFPILGLFAPKAAATLGVLGEAFLLFTVLPDGVQGELGITFPPPSPTP
jgi:hypothetical protein